jgi:hypothetical protein
MLVTQINRSRSLRSRMCWYVCAIPQNITTQKTVSLRYHHHSNDVYLNAMPCTLVDMLPKSEDKTVAFIFRIQESAKSGTVVCNVKKGLMFLP